MIKSKLQADGISYYMKYDFAGDQFAEKVLKESNDPEKKYDLTAIFSDHFTARETFQFGQYEQ